MNPAFSTHMPILKKIVGMLRPEPIILECGGGAYSTSFLSKSGHSVITLEDNETWYKKIRENARQNHAVILIKKDEWHEKICSLKKTYGKFGLVFVDQADWKIRSWTMQLTLNCSAFVVLHDAFPKNIYKFFCPIGKYHKIYSPAARPKSDKPPTMVTSHFIPIDFSVENMCEIFLNDTG